MSGIFCFIFIFSFDYKAFLQCRNFLLINYLIPGTNTHKFIFFLLCGSAPLREIDAVRAVKFLPGLKNQKTAVGSIQ
ncbi:hypothetical protein ASG38_13250 [Flavobacterium sp. Leaf359]|nr:hypothetical protein ASG38_13250 [Flavobacterium sp. Leaf359]PZQ90109.1 MAG: hypothetical protein DI548_03400 [Flavobacterium johnsoniae]